VPAPADGNRELLPVTACIHVACGKRDELNAALEAPVGRPSGMHHDFI
jgi:hypothetical protein